MGSGRPCGRRAMRFVRGRGSGRRTRSNEIRKDKTQHGKPSLSFRALLVVGRETGHDRKPASESFTHTLGLYMARERKKKMYVVRAMAATITTYSQRLACARQEIIVSLREGNKPFSDGKGFALQYYLVTKIYFLPVRGRILLARACETSHAGGETNTIRRFANNRKVGVWKPVSRSSAHIQKLRWGMVN